VVDSLRLAPVVLGVILIVLWAVLTFKRADTAERKYYREVKLPAKVDPKKAKTTYKNGVLEVTLPKKGKNRGEPIKIE